MNNQPEQLNTQEWKKRYFDTVVPQMINVDHTPALDFIESLISKAVSKEQYRIIELIEMEPQTPNDMINKRNIISKISKQ